MSRHRKKEKKFHSYDPRTHANIQTNKGSTDKIEGNHYWPREARRAELAKISSNEGGDTDIRKLRNDLSEHGNKRVG
jgi:hypothetical protein